MSRKYLRVFLYTIFTLIIVKLSENPALDFVQTIYHVEK